MRELAKKSRKLKRLSDVYLRLEAILIWKWHARRCTYGGKSSWDATSISYILPEGKLSIDMKRFSSRSRDGLRYLKLVDESFRGVPNIHGTYIIVVLINEAICTLREPSDGAVCPPVCIITILIKIATCWVEGMRQFVASDRAKRPIAKEFWQVDIKNRESGRT